MSNKHSPIILVILDGFGYSKNQKFNAIYHARKPNIDFFMKHYPHCILNASGKYVGLPSGYIGNSQVGHLTIGAGKILLQPITVINNAIENKSFFRNKKLVNNLKKLKSINANLHIKGLLSDAGVHSHENHLFAYLRSAIQNGIKNIYVHPILDGRDVAPESAIKYLNKLDKFIKQNSRKNININIGSIQGRFYALDRDKNWHRTKKSYDILTNNQKKLKFTRWQDALKYYYSQNITDEFIPPTQFDKSAVIKDNDGVIFFNFRPDRARQLTNSFTQKNFQAFATKKIKLTFFLTSTNYGDGINATALFVQDKIQKTLLDELVKKNFKIFTIAETEKYAHITYFFNGRREELLPKQTQNLVPSIKTKDFSKYPCMSAKKITQDVINSLKDDPQDFYLINYANADMVGHTGNFAATKKAIECLDEQLGKLYDQIITKNNGTLYITADHGNAEKKYDQKTKQPSKAHTTNPVPFIFIRKNLKDKKIKLPLKQLSDIKNFIIRNI